MIKREARRKPDLDGESCAARRGDDKTHDTGAAPYATEEHLHEEQAVRHNIDKDLADDDEARSSDR